MDGYAVSNIDDQQAITYTVIQSLKSLAGQEPATNLEVEAREQENKAVYVTTGAPVPDGFIAVIPIENINKNAEQGTITIKTNSSVVKEGQYIRQPGSDIAKGMLVLSSG